MLPVVNYICPGRPITGHLIEAWGIKDYDVRHKCEQLCPEPEACNSINKPDMVRALCGKVDYKIKEILKNTSPQGGDLVNNGPDDPVRSLPPSKGVFQL